jgi:SAM-dependent methyltransferase
LTAKHLPTEYDSGAFGKIKVVARDCPLCGQDSAGSPASRYSHDMWTVRNCAGCGFVYIDKAPVYETLKSVMAWEKTTKVEEQRRAEIRPISYKFSKLTRARMHLFPRRKMPDLVDQFAQPGRVVDLGCGEGGQLNGLADRFIPYGIEISEQAAAIGNTLFAQRGGGVICAPSLDGLKEVEDGFFSAATLRSYLEHETNPEPVLNELYRTLQPGGVAIIKVPNFAAVNRMIMGRKWCGFRYPDHLNYFTPRTLKAMAEKCGYAVTSGFAHKLPTSDNMYAILTKP